MSQKKFKEKYNDGCIKVFKLLQLFYEDKAKYDDVILSYISELCDQNDVPFDLISRLMVAVDNNKL